MNLRDQQWLQASIEVRRLLAAWLCQPEHDLFVEQRICERMDEAFRKLGIELPGHGSWQDALEQADERALLVEFTRLFEGPGRVPAPLYGSLYLEEGRELVGKSTLAVEAFYAAEGVGIGDDLKELPDHAAIELEFSASLLQRALAAVDAGATPASRRLVRRHREFEDRFLRDWIGELGDRVVTHAELGVYRSLGERMKRFASLVQSRPPEVGLNGGGGDETTPD